MSTGDFNPPAESIPSFDHWSPEDLSNSLTHIDFKILSRITIGELKKYVREGKLREAPVLERSITVFNNLSNWVQCMVLSKATPQERAEIVTKFVKVGKCLKKQHNYNTLMAVIGGVTHSNIARLGKTHAILASEIKKDLASLSTLLSMQSNYAQYRRALDDCKNKLHIPIMGVHLKDLIAASVGLDYEKSGRISKKKLLQLASTFSHFILFTHASSTRNQLPEPNVDLINTLKVSLDIRYNDDDMYQLSLRREPRTLLTFEPSSKSIVFADWASGVSSIPDRETVEKHIAAMVDAVFKHYDHDKDNYISHSEFRQIAGNFPFIDPFGTIDVDRDGQISRVEMNEYFMRMNKSSDFRAEFKHNFLESSFIAPTTCGNCTKVLWGFFRHGYRCTDCGLAVHDSCRDNVVAECRRKSSDKGSIDSRSDNGKDSSRGISDWFSARNSYNASFRKLLGSVRSGRYRTSSTMSQSPEPPPRSPLDCSKSAMECSSFRLRLSRTSTPTRTASESAACCYKTPSGECETPPPSATLASLACEEVSLSFDQWSPEDLSNSLTHIDFKILSRITIAELKKYVREGKLREAPVLERSITVFNNLSNWVQCMVLSKATPQERAEIVTKFVKVGKCLKKQHNYNTLMAVIGGVTHSNIARLGKTHAILASEIKKDLASLSTLLAMQSNYAQYRRALDDCKNKLHIPIMGVFTSWGVHLKDLIAGLDYEKSGRISKKKLLQLASTFSHFMLFTHASSTRNQLPEPNVDLINTLKVSLDIRYNDDDMYQLSLRREPRTLLTFESSSKSIVFADWASGVSSIPDRETVEKHIAAIVDAVFKHYDHDKDNYISQSEFRQIAGNFPFIDPFGTIDVDRDGQISRVEMNEYFMRMNKSSDFQAEFKHNFLESSFIAPTTCGNCTKVLWGFFRHGYRCTDCELAVHDSCRDNVVAECRRKSSDKGSIDSRSDNGKDSSRGISDWFSARNSYNASFRKLLGSVRSGRYRTSSTMSQSPEPPPRSPLECSKSARECSSFRLRLSRTSTPTRTASESAACCYKTPSGECETPPSSATLASLACEEVFHSKIQERKSQIPRPAEYSSIYNAFTLAYDHTPLRTRHPV